MEKSFGAMVLQTEDSMKIGGILNGISVSMGLELDGEYGRELEEEEEIVEFVGDVDRIVGGELFGELGREDAD